MNRFFVPPEILREEQPELTDELLHHLRTVLRLAPGTDLLLLDGEGRVAHCRLEQLDRRRAVTRVLARWEERERVLPLRLLQGLPKGEKLTAVLQKGTELGITVFQPVLTRRSVARPDPARAGRLLERWRTIVREAARQSGRPRLPVVEPLRNLGEALVRAPSELRLLLWEEAETPLDRLLPDQRPAGVDLLVGPEGGLESGEAQKAAAAGFRPVRLGPRILRTETAGFTVAAILQHRYGDLGAAGVAPDPSDASPPRETP